MAGSLPRDDAGRWSINNTPFIVFSSIILFSFSFSSFSTISYYSYYYL